MRTLAAVTMAYNEAEKLPIWLRHYARQVGGENCFIIDHGSCDGCIEQLEASCPGPSRLANIVKLPRVSVDEQIRVDAVGRFCSFLLSYFDWVIYTDVDELALADPRQNASLLDYCGKLKGSHVTSIGFDVIHVPSCEGKLDAGQPIGTQRSFIRFSASMCKQNLISAPTKWSKGFHTSDQNLCFDELYLFHLRFADLDMGLARLATTQEVVWSVPGENAHQKVSRDEFSSLMASQAALPVVADDPLSRDAGLLNMYLQAVDASQRRSEAGSPAQIDLHVFGRELLQLSPEFKAAF